MSRNGGNSTLEMYLDKKKRARRPTKKSTAHDNTLLQNSSERTGKSNALLRTYPTVTVTEHETRRLKTKLRNIANRAVNRAQKSR